jgi:hypothetical protein
MSRMRGCDEFEVLWDRRTMVVLPEIGELGLLSLPDLVAAKKTQREKDWPMIRRLIEVDILQAGAGATEKQVHFWLRECRTPSELIRLAEKRPEVSRLIAREREVLVFALAGDQAALEKGLREEELKDIPS